MKEFKQKGENKKYPNEIIAWIVGDKIPEWLSDKAKVKFVDGEGNITLETNETTTGGLEIKDSTGTSILVRLESKSDYVCIDKENKGSIFTLTKKQINLLYNPA